MKPLKNYIQKNSYKSIFNKIYSNFLSQDYKEDQIIKFSLSFRDFYEKHKNLDKKVKTIIWVEKNEYNLIEISYSKKYDMFKTRKPLDEKLLEEYVFSEIVNKHELPQDIIYSLIIVKILNLLDEKKK